jgi:monoamine oxidase
VLGAGIAGLGGATLLAEQGARVLVLEASRRVGGRMRSESIDGRVFDLGASEIGGNYGRVIDLAQRHAVPFDTRPTGIGEFSYHIGGRMIRLQDWAASPANLTVGRERDIPAHLLETQLLFGLSPFGDDVGAWLEPRWAELDVSVTEFLRSKGVSSAAIELAGVATDYTDFDSTSTLAVLRDVARARLGGFRAESQQPQYGGNNFDRAAFVGGAESLPRALAAKLGDRVRTGQVVVAIESKTNSVEVTCLDGSRYRAAQVLCTLPFSTLARVAIRPALPPLQAEAVQTARYGATTHVILESSQPFWEQDGFGPSIFTDGPLERVFAVRDGDGKIRFLRTWINGTGGDRIDHLQGRELEQFVIQQIETMRPAAKGKLRARLSYSWSREPFIAGHKHVFMPGQVRRLALAADQPWQRIHFAGEHLRRMEFGIEAAMETAERAVSAILTSA